MLGFSFTFPTSCWNTEKHESTHSTLNCFQKKDIKANECPNHLKRNAHQEEQHLRPTGLPCTHLYKEFTLDVNYKGLQMEDLRDSKGHFFKFHSRVFQAMPLQRTPLAKILTPSASELVPQSWQNYINQKAVREHSSKRHLLLTLMKELMPTLSSPFPQACLGLYVTCHTTIWSLFHF